MQDVHQLPSRTNLFRQRVAEFEKPVRHAEAGRVRAIHRTRVASRRLRELLPVMEVDAKNCDRTLTRLRRVTRQLGKLRELDVSAGLLDNMRDSAGTESPGVRLLRERLARARQAAFDKAEGKGLGRNLRRTAKQLAHLADGLSEPAASHGRRWRWTLDARVANRARAVVAAIDEAGLAYVAERVHGVRIAIKKLRYALELAEMATGTHATADLRRLGAAQSRLGRLHDRQVLAGWVADVRALPRARGVHAKRNLRALSADLDAECRVLHAAYLRSRAALRAICQSLLARTKGAGGTGSQGRGPDRLLQVRLA